MTATTAQPVKDMTWIPGGSFRMGSADFYSEERPVHGVTVDGFWVGMNLSAAFALIGSDVVLRKWIWIRRPGGPMAPTSR